MNFPDNLKYTQDHEWIAIDGQTGTIGITDFAQNELGDIVFVDINSVGKEVGQHEIFGTVEAVKTVSDLFIPVTGTVLEVNAKLNNSPELLNSAPYDEGWIIKINITNPAELEELMDAGTYKNMIGK
ncbi:MAG: glycine cleavage system protein GcvH [Verrucomicrobia bacterium]|nr:glycine cleavage system protein GcvH [Cytophagales bacterium]